MIRFESSNVSILRIRHRRIDEHEIHVDFKSLILFLLRGRFLSFDDCRERKHQDCSRNDRELLAIHPLHLLPAPTWLSESWRHYMFQDRFDSMQLFYQTEERWVRLKIRRRTPPAPIFRRTESK